MPNPSDTIIPAEKLTAYERWELPVLGGKPKAPPVAEEVPNRPPTAEELDQIRHLAHEEGFASGREEGLQRGLQEGLAAGQEEITATLGRLGAVMRAYAQPLATQQTQVERALLALVQQIAGAVVRRELRADEEQILALVREAMQGVARQSERLTVQLNPSDCQLIRERLETSGDWDPAWRVTENPGLTPGGCIVETVVNYVDASVEQRLLDAIDATFREPVEPE